MKTSIDSPTGLLFDQLRDLYSAGAQISDTLLPLASNATSPDLRNLLATHRQDTEQEQRVLEEIFHRHDVKIGTDKCKAIEGLIEGGNAHVATAKAGQVRDLLIIAHSFRIKHYQIAGYSFATALADCIDCTTEADAMRDIIGRHRDVLQELAQVASNFFSPCMLEITSE